MFIMRAVSYASLQEILYPLELALLAIVFAICAVRNPFSESIRKLATIARSFLFIFTLLYTYFSANIKLTLHNNYNIFLNTCQILVLFLNYKNNKNYSCCFLVNNGSITFFAYGNILGEILESSFRIFSTSSQVFAGS